MITMQKSQVNRAGVARRAKNHGRSATSSTGTVATNPALRIMTTVKPAGYSGRKGKAASSGKGQAATEGHAGWRTVRMSDRTGRGNPAWSDTMTTMPRGERYDQHKSARVKVGP